MPNVDKMAAKQIACQLLTSQEFQALDKSMALNLRIQLTLKSLLEGVARYAAINLLNVAQQSGHISPPQLNQPSSLSSYYSSSESVTVVSVHMNNNNLGAGTGFLNQQQQLISNGYALLSNQVVQERNQVVQVQESNQVLMGATTATMQQRMPTNHRSKHPSDLLDSSTSEEETSASDNTPGDKDTSSNSDHQTTAVDSLHGLNCLAVASMISQGHLP